MALSGDVANLIVALRLDDRGFSGKLNAAAAQLNAMDRGLGQMGRGAGQLGSGIGKLATIAAAAAAGGLAAVVTTAASFEQAWAGVRKTVDGSDAQLDALRDTFEDMSRTMPVTFQELAAIGEAGGALGIARESLDEFTDVVARLSVSTDLSADAAATALGQLGNVLKLSEADYQSFGDQLVALGNDGASTESQILDLTARFGAAGKSAGLSNAEILALSSTVASVGIEAEAGGGALSRVFNNMTLDIATASDEGKLLADSLGLSLGELRTAWDQDAGQVFEDLLGNIHELDQFEAAKFLKDLGITNTRDINAIRLLSQGVDEYARQLAVAEGASGELNKESQAFFDTTAGRWQTLQNNVALAADSIGAKLLPVVNELGEEFIDWLNDPAVQRGIEQFGTDLATNIRGVVDELKSTDFTPLLATMKGAVDIGRTGIDLFNRLPDPVKQLALASIIGNRVTGGALTDIAKGFTNIFSGAIKLAIPALNRGMTPLNPMFVKDVGLGGGKGPIGPIGPGGAGGFWAQLLKFGTGAGMVASATALRPENLSTDAQMDWARGVALIEAERARRGNGTLLEAGILSPEEYALFQRLMDEGIELKPPMGPPEWMRPGGSKGDGNTRLDIGDGGKRTREFLGRKLDLLPDAAMLAPGVQSLTTNLPQLPSILSEIKGVKGTGQQQLQKQAEALSAVRLGNSKLDAIRLKKSSVVVNTTVNTSVNVSATQIAQQVAIVNRSRSGGMSFLE